ncbi:hypothetical protein [Pantoea cypripedii]|uniref:Uncharacterized protein n=1 Tax=Pantoea cypripedii TaxID=55209 RepID=A0A6B9G381_PANCY|nr:hypothetical protein [Pantoea cypripedii]QGY29713.1 hypothetical protein CUN67_12540 [Pantoea cypripedii]
MSGNSMVEPGFCVVQRPGRLTEQAMFLFGNRNIAAANYFLQLNADVAWAKPGQILIVADPYGNNSPAAMNALKAAKTATNNSLDHLSADEANFFNQHYSSIAAITNFMDKSSGVIGDAGEKYFAEIGKKLTAIEVAYRNQYLTAGTLIGEQFFVKRRRLFGELDALLNKFSRLVLKLQPYQKLKHALNLSSSAIVHDWESAGVGVIRGYSTYVDGAAKAAKFMKMGGWVSIGFSALNTTNDVYDACTVGRKDECAKVAIKKYAQFGASTYAAMYGAQIGGTLLPMACMILGIATGPVGILTCGIAGAAVAGYGMGELAGGIVGAAMDKIL